MLLLGLQPARAASETERFNAWLNEVYRLSLERSPMSKTYRGIIDADYDEWDDLSPAFREETYRLGQRQLEEMRSQFDLDELDEQARLSWRLFEYIARVRSDSDS